MSRFKLFFIALVAFVAFPLCAVADPKEVSQDEVELIAEWQFLMEMANDYEDVGQAAPLGNCTTPVVPSDCVRTCTNLGDCLSCCTSFQNPRYSSCVQRCKIRF